MTNVEETPKGSKARDRRFGWFAHMGTACARCGASLGPYSHGRDIEQEYWGCAECGIGVFCEGEGQPSMDQAADIYMSVAK